VRFDLCGAAKRSGPNGGRAYGMPRYSQTSPDVATLCPMTFPFVVLIVSKYENSAADDNVHAESQVMAIGKPYISDLVSSKCEKSRKDVKASKNA
jgi:hypothetical protein